MSKYAKLGFDLGEICDEKNAAYGDSADVTGDIFRVLYPQQILPYQYDDMLLMARICDKLCRISRGGGRTALGEDAWRDLVGYALIGAGRR